MSPFVVGRLVVAALLVGGGAVLPAPAQTLSNSKLSAHLINGYTVGSSNIVAGKPRVLKLLALDSGFPTGLREAMRDYKAKVPEGKVVVRVYSPRSYSLANNATSSALDYWNTVLAPPLNGISASDRALIDYLEGPNEGDTPTLGYPSSPPGAASQWFNQFWTNLTPLMVSAGYKPCLGSIAVGNPGSLSDLDPFVPALRQAKAAGGAWSYHAYTIQYTTDVGVEFWYSLRYRQFYSYFAQQGYSDLLTLPLILTEGGVDDTGTPATSGWQARGTAAQYERWLNWFDRQINQDSYLLGCTLFENGDPTGLVVVRTGAHRRLAQDLSHQPNHLAATAHWRHRDARRRHRGSDLDQRPRQPGHVCRQALHQQRRPLHVAGAVPHRRHAR